MTGKSTFLAEEATKSWIAQFDAADQPNAVRLLQALHLLARDTFAEGLRSLILDRSKGSGPIGLYAERELNHRKSVPHKLFSEPRRKHRRAEGLGPQPVRPVKAYDPSVGSEGPIAQLITELCREFPDKFLNHPGPDQIREKRMRRFMVVTDLVGSGNRVYRYIEAAWLVRSVRSWWSARKSGKGITFEVAAFAATEVGESKVKSHASQPEVHFLHRCRTISNISSSAALRELCVRYDPVDHDPTESIGYDGIGALIAFAHGAPNNAPRILHGAGRIWVPLFPKRITAGTRGSFAEAQEVDRDALKARLLGMRERRLASVPWLASAKPHVRNLLLVLAALTRPPRDTASIIRKTELSVLEVERALDKALSNDWITDGRRLTDRGHAELDRVRRDAVVEETLSEPPELPYYPKALRAPLKVSS
jgi:hypothetical protein